MVYAIFFLIFISNILINADHGAIPGCSQEIRMKLEIGNFGFGMLGSLVFGGLTLGSVAATIIFSRGDLIRPCLAFSLFLNGASLWLFSVSTSYFVAMLSRVLIGFFQIFICIYLPVWADTFGSEKVKPMWLSFLLLAAPIGVVLGYILTYNTKVYLSSWEWSFRIQALLTLPLSASIMVTPDQYFNIDTAL